MPVLDIGKVRMTFEGAWNNSTAYVVLDVITYNGSSYVCIIDHSGVNPTNASYWQVVSAGIQATMVGSTLNITTL